MIGACAALPLQTRYSMSSGYQFASKFIRQVKRHHLGASESRRQFPNAYPRSRNREFWRKLREGHRDEASLLDILCWKTEICRLHLARSIEQNVEIDWAGCKLVLHPLAPQAAFDRSEHTTLECFRQIAPRSVLSRLGVGLTLGRRMMIGCLLYAL
jgi:hypothetical protein